MCLLAPSMFYPATSFPLLPWSIVVFRLQDNQPLRRVLRMTACSRMSNIFFRNDIQGINTSRYGYIFTIPAKSVSNPLQVV